MLERRKLLLFLSLFLLIACTSRSERKHTENIPTDGTAKGRVVRIIDGDTYDLLTADRRKYRVRMYGIDTPEKGMPYYRVAKKYLKQLCFDSIVSIQTSKRDIYDRIISFTYLSDGREVGAEMIRAGMAWHFKRYNDDVELARLEQEAKSNHLGLWKESNPTPPWVERKKRRKDRRN